MTKESKVWITGMGTEYPPHLLTADDLERIATRHCDIESAALQKLLQISRRTGIETRASISTYEAGFATDEKPPPVEAIETFFRQHGVPLAATACQKAIAEWGGNVQNITHTVAVSCTSQGNPGFDFLVNDTLNLHPDVDRTLLHGVGCAGGLAIMRTAAQIAHGASARQRPARILCYACELCTPNARAELDAAAAAKDPHDVGIAAAIFSDAAAAFVLCNNRGLDGRSAGSAIFQVVESGCAILPDTREHMSYHATSSGFRTILTRRIPDCVVEAVAPMFERLLPLYHSAFDPSEAQHLPVLPQEFDWALHPGGAAIIERIAERMHLTGTQLRATREVYRTKGNASSAGVLSVLDVLRSMRQTDERQHVVAASFGPGLAIEMAILRRCRASGVYEMSSG